MGTRAWQGRRTACQGLRQASAPSCEGSQNTCENFCSQGPFVGSNKKTPVVSASKQLEAPSRTQALEPLPAAPTHILTPPLLLLEGHAGRGTHCPPPPKRPDPGQLHAGTLLRALKRCGWDSQDRRSVFFPSIPMLTFPATCWDAEHPQAERGDRAKPRVPAPLWGAGPRTLGPAAAGGPGRTCHLAFSERPSDTEGRPGPAFGVRN